MPPMTLRSLAALAPLLVSATAGAQAPGEVAPGPLEPVAPIAIPCETCVDPYAHRISVGLSIGGLGVSPDDAAEGTAETQFRIGELAVRYRATRRLELELALSGGRQMLADDLEGDLAMGSVTLGLRYRFMPEQRWSWWLLAGLGGTVIAPQVSSEDERDAATRGLGFLGIGLERRFGQLALQAEVRFLGIGEREDRFITYDDDLPTMGGGTSGSPGIAPRLPYSSDTAYAQTLSGGMATIGLGYYF